jgi:hypothetical protein
MFSGHLEFLLVLKFCLKIVQSTENNLYLSSNPKRFERILLLFYTEFEVQYTYKNLSLSQRLISSLYFLLLLWQRLIFFLYFINLCDNYSFSSCIYSLWQPL